MTQVEWLRDQIARSKEILADLDKGVRHFRGVPGKEPVDVTDKYRAQVEDRLARNTELLQRLENSDA